jgi:hypothetical protein
MFHAWGEGLSCCLKSLEKVPGICLVTGGCSLCDFPGDGLFGLTIAHRRKGKGMRIGGFWSWSNMPRGQGCAFRLGSASGKEAAEGFESVCLPRMPPPAPGFHLK